MHLYHLLMKSSLNLLNILSSGFSVVNKRRQIPTNTISFTAVYHPKQMSLLAGKQDRSSWSYLTVLYTRFIREMLNPKYLLASPIGSLRCPLLTSAGSS